MNCLNRKKILTIVVLLLVGLATACTQNEQGGIRVHLTDAPAFFDELNVEITKVMVNRNYDDKALEWQVIYEGSMQVNILDYQHGKTLELGEAKMENGLYRQIQIFFGTENSVVINGETFELDQRWSANQEFKLPISANVSSGKIADVYIDMSAYSSVVKLQSGDYGFRPSLRVINPAEQGSISGTINPVASLPLIHAEKGGANVFSTQIDNEGFFKITGLEDGTYNLYIVPSNESYTYTEFNGIEIEAGSDYEFEETITLHTE